MPSCKNKEVRELRLVLAGRSALFTYLDKSSKSCDRGGAHITQSRNSTPVETTPCLRTPHNSLTISKLFQQKPNCNSSGFCAFRERGCDTCARTILRDIKRTAEASIVARTSRCGIEGLTSLDRVLNPTFLRRSLIPPAD